MDPEKRARAGAWLKNAREQRGISVRSVASYFDVSTQSVYGWEAGGSDFADDDRAAGLAKLLRMDLVEVRRGLGLWVPPTADDELAEPEDDPDLLRLIRQARRERDDGDPTLYRMLLRLQRGADSGDEGGQDGTQRVS